MTLITADQALAVLEDVVAEKGADYVYGEPECLYFDYSVTDDGDYVIEKPMCIVGHVLVRLETPDLHQENRGVYEDADNLPASELNGFDMLALAILTRAQELQDGLVGKLETRKSWGEALRGAREIYNTAAASDPEGAAESV